MDTPSIFDPLTLRGRLLMMFSELKTERASFISHWQELGRFILPRRTRFTVTDVNRGDRRSKDIIDSTGCLAQRTLSSGMMSGITSPARQWFKLSTPDPDLAEEADVKEWLHVVTQRMFAVLGRSNYYNSLTLVYDDLGVFATAAMGIFDDDEKVIRTESYPIGSFMIGVDDAGRVDTFAREYRMKVHQVVERFGMPPGSRDWDSVDWSNISTATKNLWDKRQYHTMVDIGYLICPNYGLFGTYDGISQISRNKKYAAYFFEMASDGDKILEQSGFDEFPIQAPRWSVTGEDTYGTNCPGMMALGDIKQLQHGERKGAQALDKMVTPPLVGPTSLRRAAVSMLPGGVTYNDARDPKSGLRPIHEVRVDLQHLEFKQQQKRNLINSAFFTDLFLMLASEPTGANPQMTAREVEERHEEKLLALGPVLENLNEGLLDPGIDRVFAIMNRKGMIPPAPESLHGAVLRVEYQSIMAQAQKMIGLGGVERSINFAVGIAKETQRADILDKIDFDEAIDQHGEMTGVPPAIIRADEEVKKIRGARAQAEQAAQTAATMNQASQAAKNLSQADTTKQNALTDLMRGVTQGRGVPNQTLPNGAPPEDVGSAAA